jgi:hypothetical protein
MMISGASLVLFTLMFCLLAGKMLDVFLSWGFYCTLKEAQGFVSVYVSRAQYKTEV